jgi:hypothetical protein
VLAAGTGVIRGQVRIEGGQLEGVRLYLYYRRAGGEQNSGGSAEVDSRGRFVIERLVPGDYELLMGPMSVYTTGEAGGKTMQRMSTVRETVNVSAGGQADVTLVLKLRP